MGSMLPFVVAGAAALAIVLVAFSVAGRQASDPVQARLTQLGAMQAKNLEELELQTPFYERVIRPMAMRLSRTVARFTTASFTATTEKRLALAGNPGDLRVTDWLGLKAISAVVFAVAFFLIFSFALNTGVVMGFLLGMAGLVIGYIFPEFWLG